MMTQSGMQYLLSFIICSVVLYGFAMVEETPTNPRERKWWDQLWAKSFQQMTWVTHPIIQRVSNYVESLHTRPHTHNTQF